MDVGADATTILSGLAGVIGFAMLFTPVTVLPGVIILGCAGGMGGMSGIVSSSITFKRGKRHKGAKTELDILFETAGIDPQSFDDLVKRVLETGKDLSTKYEISMDKALEYVQIFIINMWRAIRVLNKHTLVIQAFQNVKSQANLEMNVESIFNSANDVAEKTIAALGATRTALKSAEIGVSVNTIQSLIRIFDGVDNISGTGNIITAVKTFSNFSKGAQALQGIGLVFSIVTIGAGIHGIVKSTQQIKGGSKDALAKKLTMYKEVIKNFILVKKEASELELAEE